MLLRRTNYLSGIIFRTKAGTRGVLYKGRKFALAGTACAGGGIGMFLDTFKKDVINNIIAERDGGAVHNKLKPYFRAFTGAFTPGMPFTFYFEATNKPVMFVYDPTPIDRRSSHASFIAHCDRLKANILPITDYIQKLADEGFITVSPAEFCDRPALPQDYADYWRKYKQFYNDVMTGLSFVCCAHIEPSQKLYDVWVKFNAQALVS
jgi:hypothetical protein